MSMTAAPELVVRRLDRREASASLARLEAFAMNSGPAPLSRHPAWVGVLEDGLGHRVTVLEAVDGGRTRGFMMVAEVRSLLFGRFLVSLPYLNHGGPIGDDEAAVAALIEDAVALAETTRSRYLELRNDRCVDHPAMTRSASSKVNMVRPLPPTVEELWASLDAKVRNQVRKGQKSGLVHQWGGKELIDEFHDVFSRNMRDLGTPSYGRHLFAAILDHFPGRAEICVVRLGAKAVASALILHGSGVTEVPSASSLRDYNFCCCNMYMYNEILKKSVERGHALFDFGRSTPGGGTFHFKKQWGAVPEPAVWQYHLRVGSIAAARPDNPKYRRAIRIWRRLPVAVTRLIGPMIVRGIP